MLETIRVKARRVKAKKKSKSGGKSWNNIRNGLWDKNIKKNAQELLFLVKRYWLVHCC